LRVKPDTTKGIDVGSSGVRVDIIADHGLEFSDGDLQVKVNADKAVEVDADGLGVVPNADKAIEVSSSGVGVIANASKSISVSAAGVAVDIAASNPGLKRDGAGDLAFYPKALGGLTVEATGVSVKATTASISVSGVSGDVIVGTDGTSGIAVDAAVKGVYINLDGDTDNLEFTIGGELAHQQQAENVTKIAIYDDGGLTCAVWKGGVEINNSPNNNVIIEFDDAGHIVDASFG